MPHLPALLRTSSMALACLLALAPTVLSASTELLAGVVIAVDPEAKRVTIRVTRNIDSSGDIDVGSVRTLSWDPGAVFALDGTRVAAGTLFQVGQHVLCYPKDDGFFAGNSDERGAVSGFVFGIDEAAGEALLQQADADADSRVAVGLAADAVWLLDREPSTRAEALQLNAQLLVLPARSLTIHVLSGAEQLPDLTETHAHSASGRPVLEEDLCVLHRPEGDEVRYGLRKATCFLDTWPVPVEELVEGQQRVYGWCTRKRDYPNFLVGVSDPASHVDGVIARVDGDQLIVTTAAGEVAVAGVGAAVVTLDGATADAGALVAGRPVQVLLPRPQQIEVTSCPTAASGLEGLAAAARAGDVAARGQAVRLLYRRGIPLEQALPVLAEVADDSEAEVVEGCLWSLTHYQLPEDVQLRAQLIDVLIALIEHGGIENIRGEGYMTTGDLGQSVRYLTRLVPALQADAARLEPALQGLLGRLPDNGGKRDLAKALRKATGGE